MNQMNWAQRSLLRRLEAERGLGVEWTDEDIRTHNAAKGWDILTEDRSGTVTVELWADELAAVISAYHRPGQPIEADEDIPF